MGKGRGERGRWQSLQMFDFDGERRARGGMEERLSQARVVSSSRFIWGGTSGNILGFRHIAKYTNQKQRGSFIFESLWQYT